MGQTDGSGGAAAPAGDEARAPVALAGAAWSCVAGLAAVRDAGVVLVLAAGADTAGQDPTPESRDDAALKGDIIVSVDIQDDARAAEVKAAFAEFDASDVVAS